MVICCGSCVYKAIFPLLFEIHIGCGMMQNHWHNAETSVCGGSLYIYYHHVMVVLLNLLSGSALYKCLLTHVSCVLCCVVHGPD